MLVVFGWSRYAPQPELTIRLDTGEAEPQRAQIFLGSRNSIAVLPFTGETAEADQAFWAPGFSRELHRLMTRMSGLEVTSLNSSYFSGLQPASQALIAERLQVRNLLSGEFYESEGTVRISVRLYDAKLNVEKWTGDFEGNLTDVFAFEHDILVKLVDVLKPGQRDVLPEAKPVDPVAWAFYLQGLYLSEPGIPGGFQEAERSFLSALDIAPDYGLARVGLARLWLGQIARGMAPPGLVEATRSELVSALESQAAKATALGMLSYLRRSVDWDWAGALDTANEALQLVPGDPELMSTASLAMFSLGQFEDAGKLLSEVVARDPLNLARRLRLGVLQEFSGQYQEALGSYRHVIALNPEFPGVRAYLTRVRIIQDKLEQALEESEQEQNPFWHRYSKALALTALGRGDEARLLLDQMIEEDGGHAAYQITEILALGGETDQAFEWFQRAYDQHDGGMTEVIGNYFLENLQGDPRWAEMLDLLGLPTPEPVEILPTD